MAQQRSGRSSRVEEPRSRSEYWRSHIETWLKSGLTQVEFCEQQGLSLSAFRWWRWKLKQVDADGGASPVSTKARSAMRLVPVRVVDPQSPAPPVISDRPQTFEVILDRGLRIRVPQDFDAEALSRLVRTLEAVRC